MLTPADEEHHIDKRDFRVPFVCGARNLGEALRRIAEGAAMIRTKGEAGSGNIVEAVRHIRTIVKEMKQLTVLGKEELMAEAKKHQAPLELVRVRRGERQTAGAELLGGRHCYSGGCRAGDAAWSGSRVRRFGNLQVVGSGSAGARDREGGDVLQGSREAARGERRTGHGDAGLDITKMRRRRADADARLVRGVKKRVGVLALQGDFEAHEKALARAGAEAVEVRTAGELQNVQALVIPGGESTTMLKLLDATGLREPLRRVRRNEASFRHVRRRDSASRSK